MNQSSEEDYDIDWSGCPLVWTDPERMHGTHCIIDTRIPAASVPGNHETSMELDGLSWDDALLATHECFPDVSVETMKTLIAYWNAWQPEPESPQQHESPLAE